MNIFELAASNSTAKLNATLNPTIWTQHEHLKTAVRDQIMIGAEEYCSYLGLTEAQVNDIVISGDTASFRYTDQSAIDVVVVADLDPDPTFREFFNENKYRYNGQHQVQVNGHLVQFYVQPADEQFINNGSYSVLSESWVQIPRRQLVEDTVSQLRAVDQAARPRPKALKKKKPVKEAIVVKYGFGADFLDEVGVTPDGVSASTCQFANEDDAPVSKEDTVQDFVQFCSDQLGLAREPELKLKRDPEWSKRARTFGRYNPNTNQLEVSLANRHVMDILRTVAHELTHQHQHERESVPDHAGETGSEWENEANARAGILMRDYGHTHPELFAQDITESSGYIPTAAQADDPRFEMALTADVRPGATGRAANAFLLNTDAQGHPQQLRADGMVQRMIEDLEQYKTTYNKKITNETLGFLNSKIPMDDWFTLIENYHTQHLLESVDESVIEKIDNICNSFSTKNLKIGNKYIPNMLMGVGHEISVYDSMGVSPPANNKSLTLTKINGIYLTFVTDDGEEKTYPEKRVAEKLYTRTVVCDSPNAFKKYAMWMSINYNIAIPDAK